MPARNKSTGDRRAARKQSAPQWSIADAKARLSEVVEKSRSRAQTLTRNGKPVAVVVGIDEWKLRTQRKGTLLEFFKASPLWGSDLDMRRDPWPVREVDL